MGVKFVSALAAHRSSHWQQPSWKVDSVLHFGDDVDDDNDGEDDDGDIEPTKQHGRKTFRISSSFVPTFQSPWRIFLRSNFSQSLKLQADNFLLKFEILPVSEEVEQNRCQHFQRITAEKKFEIYP